VRHILLFDVDSVLVDPQGYLRALQDSVAHFTHHLGVGAHPPTEDEVRTFEAMGLTSEWDSGATCVGALLVERLRAEPHRQLPGSWPEAMVALAAHPHPLPHPDYAALAYRVGALIGEHTTTAEAARRTLGEMAEAASLDGTVALLLDALLGHTHDFHRAPFTRHFQHLAIGSGAIKQTYGVPPDFESPAYLLEYDMPLLTAESRARLDAIAAEDVGVALYTARPSLPPSDIEMSPRGYSPEAEMARELVGLDIYPLIGLGSVRWLAGEVDKAVNQLVKPSPVQALAAIGAAARGRESVALKAAYALVAEGKLQPPLSELGTTTVHIFEDTVSGIGAVEQAVELLQQAGCDVKVRAYGIVPKPGTKALRMKERRIERFPTVNEALAAALERASEPLKCCDD